MALPMTLREYLKDRELNPWRKYDLEQYQPDDAVMDQIMTNERNPDFHLVRFKTSDDTKIFLVDYGVRSRLMTKREWDWELANSEELAGFQIGEKVKVSA